jgi:hypothetical protein
MACGYGAPATSDRALRWTEPPAVKSVSKLWDPRSRHVLASLIGLDGPAFQQSSLDTYQLPIIGNHDRQACWSA